VIDPFQHPISEKTFNSEHTVFASLPSYYCNFSPTSIGPPPLRIGSPLARSISLLDFHCSLFLSSLCYILIQLDLSFFLATNKGVFFRWSGLETVSITFSVSESPFDCLRGESLVKSFPRGRPVIFPSSVLSCRTIFSFFLLQNSFLCAVLHRPPLY